MSAIRRHKTAMEHDATTDPSTRPPAMPRGPSLGVRPENRGAESGVPGSPRRFHKNLNLRIARRLEEVTQLLEAQGDNLYRVQAYRRAAETLQRLPRSVAEIVRREGEPGLRRLPGIGESLARSIATLVLTGKLPMLHRLRGESEAGLLLSSVPGIGKRLADRLHHDLGIDSLEELEAAAHDGRLKEIAGIGYKRLAAITDSLSARLGRVRPLRAIRKTTEPAVAEILDVDREYRMTFVDTARSNTGAIKFFRRMGNGKPEAEVWMSKLIQRPRKNRNSQRYSTRVARWSHAKLRRKIAKRRRKRKPLPK